MASFFVEKICLIYLFFAEFITVFRWRTIGTFFKTPAEGSQIIKTRLECNVRDRNVGCKKSLRSLYSFVRQIIIKSCICMELK